MTTRITTVLGVVGISVLLAVYIVAVGFQAWTMLISGAPLVVAMGAALILFPILGIWVLVRELRFGFASSSLARALEAEGRLPDFAHARRTSGRIDRRRADALFPDYAHAVEASPQEWQAWFRLGLAYDACGDRRRARSAIRRAISLSHPPENLHREGRAQ